MNVHRSPDACYLSRHVALKVGARVETPALTVNRLCGSGFETVVQVGTWLAIVCCCASSPSCAAEKSGLSSITRGGRGRRLAYRSLMFLRKQISTFHPLENICTCISCPFRPRAHLYSCRFLSSQQGSEAIQLGKASITLCAGTENMSSAPLVVSGNDARWAMTPVHRPSHLAEYICQLDHNTTHRVSQPGCSSPTP